MTSGNAAGAGNERWGQIAGGTHTLTVCSYAGTPKPPGIAASPSGMTSQ
jgi:hypothetical protein